jgi:1-acyl-sn-glycerol-3-phosphate acyltransferase
MGSVVFPEAELKVFLEADPAERARRRRRDFAAQGRSVDEAAVRAELEQRDEQDSRREHSPLIKPADAVVIDTSGLSIDEQVRAVIRLADARWTPPRIEPELLLWPGEAGQAPPRAGMRRGYRAAWLTVRGLLRLLFGIRYHGAECCPRAGPLLVASNHISWLDPLVCGSAVPRELTFVAKRELFGIPLFKGVIRYFNAVPIKRGTFDRACFDVLLSRLRAGHAVIFYPEGTRKPVGRLGRAKFGLGLVADDSGAPIQPLFIKGATRWKRALLRRERVQVYFGRPLHIAPLRQQGLRGRELYDAFGEGVMAEIARLQREAGGAF